MFYIYMAKKFNSAWITFVLYISCQSQFGQASVELTDLLSKGGNLLTSSLFMQYEDYVSTLKKYSAALEDMLAAGGFEFAAKNAR